MTTINNQDYLSVYLESKKKKSENMSKKDKDVYDVYLENLMGKIQEARKRDEGYALVKQNSKVYFLK
jgi:hypothetical protein